MQLEYVLQFKFKKAHIASIVITAAVFLSRLELKVTEIICLKLREDVQTTPIEVSTSSMDVAGEEQFFFTQPDIYNESEKQTIERKEQSKQNAMQWMQKEEPSSLETSVKEFKRSPETLRRIP